MSVSDPLLKILKAHILRLHTETDVVSDYHPVLYQLCDTVEQIFRKGLRKQNGLFGLSKKDYFSWISALPDYFTINRISPLLTYAVSAVKESKQLKTLEGRGRLYIRYGLQRKSLDTCVIYLRRAPALLQQWYDSADSIIADDILSEIFLSLLQELKRINFRLHLEVQSFLDDTWLIPVMKRFEFPPTKTLGLEVRYVDGRALTTAIQEGSAAADRNLQVGDVLDQIFDISLNGVSDGKISTILRDVQGYPIYLTIVKAMYVNGRIFPPIARRMATLGIDVEGLEETYPAHPRSLPHTLPHPLRHTQAGMSSGSSSGSSGSGSSSKQFLEGGGPQEYSQEPMGSVEADSWATHLVKFVGKAEIGTYGGVKAIDASITRVVSECQRRQHPFKHQQQQQQPRLHQHQQPPMHPASHSHHASDSPSQQWTTRSPFSSASSLSTAPSTSSSSSSTFVGVGESVARPQSVLVQLGEARLVVKELQTRHVLWRHSYTEISSCGRRAKDTTLFAYIAGETSCSLAEQFVCYVFEAKTDEEAKTILCSIAQGFDRTHWLM